MWAAVDVPLVPDQVTSTSIVKMSVSKVTVAVPLPVAPGPPSGRRSAWNTTVWAEAGADNATARTRAPSSFFELSMIVSSPAPSRASRGEPGGFHFGARPLLSAPRDDGAR